MDALKNAASKISGNQNAGSSTTSNTGTQGGAQSQDYGDKGKILARHVQFA